MFLWATVYYGTVVCTKKSTFGRKC